MMSIEMLLSMNNAIYYYQSARLVYIVDADDPQAPTILPSFVWQVLFTTI